MEELVSIVIPIYNVEKYLTKCIDSIINQSYKNIEILFINDGSIDNSQNICEKYLKIDSRIRLYNKKNGGLSSARNFGLKKALGKYIMFIDSDDYISYDIIEKCVKQIKKDDSDICCFAKKYIYKNHNKIVNNKHNFCINSVDALRRLLLMEDIDNSACDKLYKRELFKNIVFPLNKYYEDIGTTYKVFLNSNKVSHIKDIGYYYNIRSNSITTENFSCKQFDYIELAKKQMDDIITFHKNLKTECEAFYYLAIISVINKYNASINKKDYKNEIRKIYEEFNINFKNIMKNEYIPFLKKIMCILLKFKMYKMVFFIKKIIRR